MKICEMRAKGPPLLQIRHLLSVCQSHKVFQGGKRIAFTRIHAKLASEGLSAVNHFLLVVNI